MSASREKKQRQGAGPSEKATQVQQEQAAYKRKSRIYTVIGIVVVVLIAALLIWNSGLFQSRATAATVGEQELSVAELGYFYHLNRYQYALYGLLDTSKSDAEQSFGDQSYRDYFLETALANAQEIYAMYDLAVKEGYSASDVAEDVDASIESAKDAAASNNGMSYKSYLKAMYGSYMTPAVYKDIITKTLIANEYYSNEYTATLESFSAEDFQAYYEEHADDLDEIEYSYLQFRPETVDTKDADGNELSEDEIAKLEEEALAAAKEKAEEALAAYEDGADLTELIEESKPNSSGNHTVVQGVSAISSSYSEDLLKLGADEAALVETESSGYYVVIFHSKGRNETLAANVRHILAMADYTVAEDGTIVAPGEKYMEEAKAEAEAALAEFEAGEKTPEAFAALVEKYSDDTASVADGGYYENVVENDFVTELNDWMFGEEKPEVGDTAVIRHDGDPTESSPYWGYHVMYLEGWGMAFWELDARDSLTAETMEEWLTSLSEGDYAAALADGAKNLGN